MNTDTSKPTSNPIATWATGLGAAGLFGGLLLGLSKGGGFSFAVGMSLPVGFVAAIVGAVVGVLIKAFNK